MKDIILETKDLCKSFKRPGGTQTVLNKMNLQIYEGKMLAISNLVKCQEENKKDFLEEG